MYIHSHFDVEIVCLKKQHKITEQLRACKCCGVYYNVELNETITVSFHNFKSQNFKLSVSNPQSKYDDYLYCLNFQIARV